MQKQGFVLLEVITAVVILSTLMVVTAQVWQSMAHNRHQQDWVNDAELIRQASIDYWMEHGAPPAALSDVFTPTQLSTLTMPWRQSWFYVASDNWLELSLTAPSTAAAEWFAGQIAGAFVQGERLIVPIWQPTGVLNTELFLHRQHMLGKPQLNSMEADLNMTNHAITNVDTLTAEQATIDVLQAQTVFVDALRASTMDVNTLYVNDVVTPRSRLSELAYWVEQYEQLWLSCQQQGHCL